MAVILHFSDVHFPLRHGSLTWHDLRHPKRWLALANFLVRRRFVFREAPRKWAAFLAYVRSHSFDAIVCTGDLTTMGTKRELQAARQALAELLPHPAFVLLPGNHDLYLPGDDAGHFRRVFEPYYAALQHRPPAECPPESWPFLKLIGKDAALLALNSAKPNPVLWRSSGRVPETALEAIGPLLQHEELLRRRIILATHYNPDDEDTWRHGLENREEVRSRLNAYPIDLYVHGHTHRTTHRLIEGFRPRVACAGSLTYKHHEGFWVYDVREDAITLRRGRWTGHAYCLDPSADQERG